MDIAIGDAKVRAQRIRGLVINGMTGQPAAGAHVRLVPQTMAPHLIMPNANADKSGAFSIGGVAPGDYSLVAAVNPSRGGGQGETFFDVAAVPVAVVPLRVGEITSFINCSTNIRKSACQETNSPWQKWVRRLCTRFRNSESDSTTL